MLKYFKITVWQMNLVIHDSPFRPSHFGRQTQEFYTCSLLSCQPWLVGIKVDNSKENRHKILEFIFQNGMVQQVNQVCLDRIWPLKKKQSQIWKSDFLHFQQADRQSSAQPNRLIWSWRTRTWAQLASSTSGIWELTENIPTYVHGLSFCDLMKAWGGYI